MSDQLVAEALDQLEGILAAEEVPSAEAIAAWRDRFDRAAANAQRGPTWPEILRRAQDLGIRLEQRVQALSELRDGIRQELEHQAVGNRALKGYGASLRP